MRSSRLLGLAVALSSVATCAVLAWLISGSDEDRGKPGSSPGGKALPAFWSGPPPALPGEESAGEMTTHGGWFCVNPDCRFLGMSGGKVFRSAKPQNCSICREPLTQDRPVAAVPRRGGFTGPEGG